MNSMNNIAYYDIKSILLILNPKPFYLYKSGYP